MDRSVTYVSDSAHYTALGPVFEKVGTPFPESSKSVTAERTAPDGGTVRATIGEKVTYELRLNIPDTSTLYDLEMVDVVPDGLQVRSATYSINGATAVEMDRTVNDADGTTTVSATTNPFNDVSGFTGVADDIIITMSPASSKPLRTAALLTRGRFRQQRNSPPKLMRMITVLTRRSQPQTWTFTIVEPNLVDKENQGCPSEPGNVWRASRRYQL